MISIGAINYPPEEIEYSSKDMRLRINNSGYERGELIITKSEIAWKKENLQEGFSIPWDKIVVQAISSENGRSIYFMIDCLWPNNQEQNQQQNEADNQNGSSTNGNHEDDEENEEFIDCDDEVSDITEFWLVPDDLSEVDNIYYAMTKYPEQGPMEESSGDENFLDGEDMEQMNINDERFADD